MKQVEIFTDGACKGNPGPGGWGALLRMGPHEKELVGGDPDTTNNRMEMIAAIKALGALIEPCEVDLYTDSKYLIDGITKWSTAGRNAVGSMPARSRSATPIYGTT